MTTTTSAYLAISQNLPRYQAMTAAEPAVQSATAYYEANIGRVTSIEDLVGNYRLLSYALDAYGLGDQIDSTALITQVLEGGVSNPNSLANTLSNSAWKAFAAAFNFVGAGASSVSSATGVETTTSDYVEQQLESDQGAQNAGVELALYFQRVAPTVTSEYGILADPNLLEVAQTIFGLSQATSAENIDTQAQAHADLRSSGSNEIASAHRAVHRDVRPELWDIEDAIRTCERKGDFGPTFVALARSVYGENDVRAALKRAINTLANSALIEEKSYA
jgi:hypothetical protein